jgi:hypothetical protein
MSIWLRTSALSQSNAPPLCASVVNPVFEVEFGVRVDSSAGPAIPLIQLQKTRFPSGEFSEIPDKILPLAKELARKRAKPFVATDVAAPTR